MAKSNFFKKLWDEIGVTYEGIKEFAPFLGFDVPEMTRFSGWFVGILTAFVVIPYLLFSGSARRVYISPQRLQRYSRVPFTTPLKDIKSKTGKLRRLPTCVVATRSAFSPTAATILHSRWRLQAAIAALCVPTSLPTL